MGAPKTASVHQCTADKGEPVLIEKLQRSCFQKDILREIVKSVCPTVPRYDKLSGCKNKIQESSGSWSQYQETSCCRKELCHMWCYIYFLPKKNMNSDNLNQIIISDNDCESQLYLVGNMVGNELSFITHLKSDYLGDYWISVGALEKRQPEKGRVLIFSGERTVSSCWWVLGRSKSRAFP